jgi:hypothetical protein
VGLHFPAAGVGDLQAFDQVSWCRRVNAYKDGVRGRVGETCYEMTKSQWCSTKLLSGG